MELVEHGTITDSLQSLASIGACPAGPRDRRRRAARGLHRPGLCRREVIAHTRASLDITDPDAVRQAVAGDRARRHHQLRGVQRRRRRESRAVEALAVNAFAVRSLARPPTRPARRSCTTAPTSSSNSTAASPTTRTAAVAAQRVCRVEAARRMVRARRAARLRAARGEPVWSPRGLDRPARHARSHRRWPRAGREVKVFTDRVVSPSYSRTSRLRPGIWSERRAARRSITASTPATRRGTRSPRRRRGSSA